ncbi:MAG: efflux RND transporter periplasmic adaptor subunit [Pyrinomonadaceae bacterium]|nr:efflux RND transporter periplasmic adaptor subunit [Pyrinomonadaceae bacterium]MDQ3175469.1 efflux RND transporter periplasmic adaptor subunit [Acidobacteriota bacterium]
MFSHRLAQVVPLAVVVVTLSVFSVSCGGSKANVRNEATPLTLPAVVDVTTAPAITRDLPRFFEATGSLAGDQQTEVASSIAGKVVAVGVDLGSYVKRGQMIVRLDDVDSKLRVAQAQAQVEQAKAALRQAEEKVGLRPGQAFDPNRIPEVANARVALELAEKNLRRSEKLIESGDVSRSSYDQQKAQRDQLKEQYESALSLARQNYAAVMTARANVANAGTLLGLARRALSYALVFSPIDGYVAERNADLGEYVSPTSKVATVVRINPLRIRIDIPEQAIPEVSVGQSVSVTTSAWPDKNFSGRIARISPNVTASSRTLSVEADIENNGGALKPGQFATVRILQSRSQPAVLIPARAVRTESGVSRVFVIKDGRAEQRLVQLGQSESDLVEVKSGVAAGEQVATSNIDQVSDGMAVRQ